MSNTLKRFSHAKILVYIIYILHYWCDGNFDDVQHTQCIWFISIITVIPDMKDIIRLRISKSFFVH